MQGGYCRQTLGGRSEKRTDAKPYWSDASAAGAGIIDFTDGRSARPERRAATYIRPIVITRWQMTETMPHISSGESTMKDKDQKLNVPVLEKLLARVEAAAEGSPELDREIAAVFPSAPPEVTRSIDAIVNLINAELPNWWWTCGYCRATNDASLYPPGSYKHAPWWASKGICRCLIAVRLFT